MSSVTVQTHSDHPPLLQWTKTFEKEITPPKEGILFVDQNGKNFLIYLVNLNLNHVTYHSQKSPDRQLTTPIRGSKSEKSNTYKNAIKIFTMCLQLMFQITLIVCQLLSIRKPLKTITLEVDSSFLDISCIFQLYQGFNNL